MSHTRGAYIGVAECSDRIDGGCPFNDSDLFCRYPLGPIGGFREFKTGDRTFYENGTKPPQWCPLRGLNGGAIVMIEEGT